MDVWPCSYSLLFLVNTSNKQPLQKWQCEWHMFLVMRSVLFHQHVEGKLLPKGEVFSWICIYFIKTKRVILNCDYGEMCTHTVHDSWDVNNPFLGHKIEQFANTVWNVSQSLRMTWYSPHKDSDNHYTWRLNYITNISTVWGSKAMYNKKRTASKLTKAYTKYQHALIK